MRTSHTLTHTLIVGLALSFLLTAPVRADRSQPTTIKVPTYITKAMADPARATDKANDAHRRPGPVLAFTGVKPGDTVVDLVPGSGYWTRMFSQIVGANGHVYAAVPAEFAKAFPSSMEKIKAIATNPHYSNVTVLVQPAAKFDPPTLVDLVFTAENMHDYNNPLAGHILPKTLATEVIKALKPDGVFLVNDHVAAAGSGLSDTNTLHRIDPATVKSQVIAAGFTFDGASTVLRNPKDPHDIKVFDPMIRGHTDQFVYRFRKMER